MTDLNSYHLTSSGLERVDAMPDPTDADLSAITEAELDEIEARLKHGDNFLIRKDAWTLHDALRACRQQSKAQDKELQDCWNAIAEVGFNPTEPLAPQIRSKIERALTCLEQAKAKDAVIAAAGLIDVGVVVSKLYDMAKREPGPWAKPHIDALYSLENKLAALDKKVGDA